MSTYNEHKSRSELEARWARFLDELGVKYEYEPQSFAVSNDLPDFKIKSKKDNSENNFGERTMNDE